MDDPPASDTICACSTSRAASLRALVRISGPRTSHLARDLLDPPPEGRAVIRTRLRLKPASLPVLCASYPGPASFTGEDVLEIIMPGGPPLVDRVLDVLTSHPGVRLAQPGEFSARAFEHGRMTLRQAEALQMRIAARTAGELRAARRWQQEDAGRRFESWRDELAHLLALVEAEIDFADSEEVVAIERSELRARLESLQAQMEQWLGRAARAAPQDHPIVALVGAPNAGKSTLFNALLGRRRAVTSDQAGTTRDALLEPLDLRDCLGPTVTLADLPGLDEDLPTPERQRALDVIQQAQVLIHCDPLGRFGDLDRAPHPAPAATVIRVRTKADLPAPPTSGLSVCALDHWGIAPLRRALADAVAQGQAVGDVSIPMRAAQTGRLACEHLASAIGIIDDDPTLSDPAILASEMRAALDALGELSGHCTPDDVIGRIFAMFCLGK